MINARRIVSPEDGLYAECVRIYEESFPYEERRDTAEMTEYLSDARFHFIVFYEQREEDGPAGFFTFWDFGSGYLYGEHFAVNPSLRGRGTGTAIRYRYGHTGLYQEHGHPDDTGDRASVRG